VGEQIAAGAVLILFGVLLLLVLYSGTRVFIHERNELTLPVSVFIGGFVLIHMVYQNSKYRYALPLLWFTTMILFMGLERRVVPALKKLFHESRRYRKNLVTAIAAGLYIFSWYLLFNLSRKEMILFALLFQVAPVLVYYGNNNIEKNIKEQLRFSLLLFMLSGAVIGNNIYYTEKIINHQSMSRIEFRKVGEWFGSHYKEGDRMLISERSVAVYYSGLESSNFFPAERLRSKSVDGLVEEIASNGLNYIYFDDYYARRLKVNDKNAIDKNAALLKELRERAGTIEGFRLVKKIPVSSGINGSLYSFRKKRADTGQEL
jgi:hypothetical protein